MTDAVRELLKDKTLCGDANGAKILFTSVDLIQREIEKKPVYFLQLTGEARGYLLNAQNPDRGAEALVEPVSVTIEQNTEKDAAIQLSNLSRALGLPEEDKLSGEDPDWLDRFTEDHPKSVIPALKEKGMYVKTTLKNNWEKAVKYGESPFYFNAYFVPVREAVSKDSIAAIKAKMMAKAAPAAALEGIA